MYGEGQTRGRVSILKKEMASNQACCNIVINDKEANYEYVYYFLKSQYNQIRALSSGVRKNLNSDNIKNLEILLPSKRSYQNDVAEILSEIDRKIITILKEKQNIIPVNINWLGNWKKRMSKKKFLKDAENLIIKNGKLFEIGTKLNSKKLPKHQFMGIIKLKKKTFDKCYVFFKKLKNKKIDMTSFINLCIKNEIMILKVKKYRSYWYEIDTAADQKFAEYDIKKKLV